MLHLEVYFKIFGKTLDSQHKPLYHPLQAYHEFVIRNRLGLYAVFPDAY